MPEVTQRPAPPTTAPENSAAPSLDVYAVYGVEPEVQAYAMAKYSRSALSMRESLKEINQQKAEKFLDTFYFQYGHRSIADLAHLALAIERLSILAAIVVADEQRWDGQERSTRYQDFKKSGCFHPDFGDDLQARRIYKETVDNLFREYEALSEKMFRYLAGITPRPAEMKQEAYDRTLKARAFDISRYLLPLGTNTSLGEIVNARTLESQVAHLLSHSHREVRYLGEALKRAATAPAYNVNEESLRALVGQIRAVSPDLGEKAAAELLREVRVSPTLVKYADPSAYEIQTRRELQDIAGQLMGNVPVANAESVDLLDDEPLEIELAATLIYEHCHYPYRQIRQAVEAAPEAIRREIIDAGMRSRGKHDELLRPFRAGQQLRFDILMDIGGFRDLHRHRRCIQIEQAFTARHGYDSPEELKPAGAQTAYDTTMRQAAAAVEQLAQRTIAEAVENSQYAIPLGFRKRTLFKMDFAEAVYISELRTTPAGHFSYRQVAFDMFRAVAERYPALARYFRVPAILEKGDLLKR
ncbi:MAG TPA: FAD-dependent thymidylate synthase [Terriglobales bacterium]